MSAAKTRCGCSSSSGWKMKDRDSARGIGGLLTLGVVHAQQLAWRA
jgi:hypothetical protein